MFNLIQRLLRRRAFVLSELIVALVIVAALSGAVLAGTSAAVKSSRISGTKSDLYNFGVAFESAFRGQPNIDKISAENKREKLKAFMKDVNSVLLYDYQLAPVDGTLAGNITKSAVTGTDSDYIVCESNKLDPWGNPYYVMFDRGNRGERGDVFLYITAVSAGPNAHLDLDGNIGGDDIFLLTSFVDRKIATRLYGLNAADPTIADDSAPAETYTTPLTATTNNKYKLLIPKIPVLIPDNATIEVTNTTTFTVDRDGTGEINAVPVDSSVGNVLLVAGETVTVRGLAAGTTMIDVSVDADELYAPSETVQFALTVVKHPNSLTLSETSADILVGEDTTFDAFYSGDGELSAVSSDTDIATVSITDNHITVTAVGSGTAEISVSVAETDLYLGAGPEIFTLNASYAPSKLTFSSDDPFTLGTTLNTGVWNGTMLYSQDDSTWTEWDGSDITSGVDNKLYLRGEGNTYVSNKDNYFTLTGTDIYCSGNLESLLDGDVVAAGGHPAQSYTGTYKSLFKNCSALKSAPELGATTMVYEGYYELFSGCTGLEAAPELPATALAGYCYYKMFFGCTALVSAPALPATTLANDCYGYMFSECTVLATAPALPSTALAQACYMYMFSHCSSLTEVPALPATVMVSQCYRGMFDHCSSLTATGTLPATTLDSWCYGAMFSYCANLTTTCELPVTTLAERCYCAMFRGCYALTSAPALPATVMQPYCYDTMFSYCTALAAAPELPATTLATACYHGMFENCTSITAAPALPATTLTLCCYWNMFARSGITAAPVLPATTLVERCYQNMFQGCMSLTEAPALPATNLATSCYECMFSDCTYLSGAPVLPATTMAEKCYRAMFEDCSALHVAPELPATTLAVSCYEEMFLGAGIHSAPALPATTLFNSCYKKMFAACGSLTELPALPATTLADNCYYQMFSRTNSSGVLTNIKLSETQTGEYVNEYRLPAVGSGTTATDALTDMFYGTGGTFTGTPAFNTTYYTSLTVVE